MLFIINKVPDLITLLNIVYCSKFHLGMAIESSMWSLSWNSVECDTSTFRSNISITRAPPMGAGRSTFSYLILNCKQFTKLYILLTMMVISANKFARLVNIIRGV